MWWFAALLLADTAPHYQTSMVAVSARESLAVETAGVGPPVVLVPGLFGSAFGFRKVVSLLTTAGYSTIVIEPLGVGSSTRPGNADYSLTAQAARVALVLDSLHVRDALVVGHSIGGAEALRLAYGRPDLVRGLLTIESGPTEQTFTPSLRRALRFAPWIRLFGGVGLLRRKVRSLLRDSSGDTTWVIDDVINSYTAGAARDLRATLEAYLAMASAREPNRLAPHLGEIHCPVRLLVGTARHDGGVTAEEVRLLEGALRSFAIDSAVGAGHFVQEEQPEAVVGAVRRLEWTLSYRQP